MEVQVLKRQGRSIRQIAKEMELSRNTVRRYLRERPAVKYGPREARPCKLDSHKAHLKLRIEQARPDWIPATVLLREIQAAGYVGGISQLKSYLAQFKVQRADPVVRFETAPGQQMQADFTIIRRGSDRLLAFVATLGFSRATFARFTDTEDFSAWRDGVVGALEYFGGVPQEVLFDNAKSIIIERDCYGPGLHRWHAGMLECARDYGFSLRVCRPYRARTKGKVERFNGYMKRSFLVPLNATCVATYRSGAARLRHGRLVQPPNIDPGYRRDTVLVLPSRRRAGVGDRSARHLAVQRSVRARRASLQFCHACDRRLDSANNLRR